MFISTIFLIISFVPLILLYENRKPQAREIVIISVMSAFTVIANLIIIGTTIQTISITKIAYRITKNKYGYEEYKKAQEVTI